MNNRKKDVTEPTAGDLPETLALHDENDADEVILQPKDGNNVQPLQKYWKKRHKQTKREAIALNEAFDIAPTYARFLNVANDDYKNALHEVEEFEQEFAIDVEDQGQTTKETITLSRFGYIRKRFPSLRRKTFKEKLTAAQQAVWEHRDTAVELTKRGVTSVDDAPNALNIADILPFSAQISEMLSRGLLSGFGFISYGLEAGGAVYSIYQNIKHYINGDLTTARFVEEMMSESFRLIVSLGALTVASLIVAAMVGAIPFGFLNVFIPTAYVLIIGRETYAFSRQLHMAKLEEALHRNEYVDAKKAYRAEIERVDEATQKLITKVKKIEGRKKDFYEKLKTERLSAADKYKCYQQIDELSNKQARRDDKILALQAGLADKKAEFDRLAQYKKTRLAAERDLAFTTVQLAIGIAILAIVALATIAVTAAGIGATMGVATPAFVVLGFAGAGLVLKVFHEVDKLKGGAYSRAMRKFFTNLGDKIKRGLGFSSEGPRPPDPDAGAASSPTFGSTGKVTSDLSSATSTPATTPTTTPTTSPTISPTAPTAPSLTGPTTPGTPITMRTSPATKHIQVKEEPLGAMVGLAGNPNSTFPSPTVERRITPPTSPVVPSAQQHDVVNPSLKGI